MNKIKVAILGYGNLARGVESAVLSSSDMELSHIFSRRGNLVSDQGIKIKKSSDILKYKNEIDVLVLTVGSANDLPKLTPEMAKYFNVVDSFDTHQNINLHIKNIAKNAGENTAIVSTGWDPGLFSLMRTIFDPCLPQGKTYTFWGLGVSQGHSEAIKRIDGVKKGVQYTVPLDKALKEVRENKQPKYKMTDMHKRVCYVVAENGANKKEIEKKIVNMENYFKGYQTEVHFITEKEFDKKHKQMPHGGHVIHSGKINGNDTLLEFTLKLKSNPLFTGSVLAAYARACYKLNKDGKKGVYTVVDVPAKYLIDLPYEKIIEKYI